MRTLGIRGHPGSQPEALGILKCARGKQSRSDVSEGGRCSRVYNIPEISLTTQGRRQIHGVITSIVALSEALRRQVLKDEMNVSSAQFDEHPKACEVTMIVPLGTVGDTRHVEGA